MNGSLSALSPANIMALSLLGGLVVLLLVAALSDLRSREIPNLLNLVIALGAPLYWWAQGMALWPDVAIQVAAAAAIFLAFFAMFAFGAIGGGDVKMIGALALWIDAPLLLSLLQVMALVGGVIAGAMLIHKKLRNPDAVPEVPYGVAITIAGFWAIHQQYINHFTVIPIT